MRRRLAGNVIWNWSGMVATMLTGFVVAPYLLHHLNTAVYGIWILIASMSGYFGLLDLGVRGSVGRYIAYYRARNEQHQINATLSTAITILSGVALLTLLATWVVLAVFFHLFEVPPEYVATTRLAIIIMGVNLAITFPVSVFDGVLWGYERFDLINIIDIPTAIARMVLTFWLVKGPQDILLLAWITLGYTVANELVKMLLCFRLDRQLRVNVKLFDRKQAQQLYGYGLWQFLLQISRQIGGQVGPLIVGGVIGVATVTPFAFASRLIAYASQFMVAATGVLTPLATVLHAQADGEGERRLFMEGGKWCTAFATYITLGMLLLGGPLLHLWVRDPTVASEAAAILMVVTLGEMLAMSQWLTYSIILGKARHRALALASLVEGIIAVAGGALAASRWGVMGVAVVFAAAAFACRGVFQVVYSCGVVQVGVLRYVMQAVLWPMAVGMIPGAILAGMIWWHMPQRWSELAGYGVGFSLLFWGSTLWLLGAAKYLPARTAERRNDAVMEKIHG